MVLNNEKTTIEIINMYKKLQDTDGKELCKAVRKAMKLNQNEFGKLIGFSSPNIRVCKIENGKEPLSNIVRTNILLLAMVYQNNKEFINGII